LVGADDLLGGAPTGSCTAIGASTAGATSKAAKKTKNSSATQQTTTQQPTKKKQKKTSTTERLLNDAGEAVDHIGTSIGNLFE
jgi:ribosome-binding protein aMBF1 (putative translation factor)